MKRSLVVVAIGIAAVALVLVLRQPRLGPSPYTASDPALVGSTGRVQLVEFFHHR
jgi:hypothetical protein